jgi:predicted GIY-YIG superfamily endonuclease
VQIRQLSTDLELMSMRSLETLVPSLPEHIDLSTLGSEEATRELSARWSVQPIADQSIIRDRIDYLRQTGRLDGTHILKAISLEENPYKAWLSERKTRFIIDGKPSYLKHIHDALGFGAVSLNALRSRLKRLASEGSISGDMLIEALTMSQARWQAKVGTGRSRGFTYDGSAFPEQTGKWFASVSWFLDVIGRSELKSTVHARLKTGWKLDDAILEPVLKERGRIYLLRCRATGLCYIGLTTNSIERRFEYHKHRALGGSRTLLHSAIRKYGAEQFDLELLETVDDEMALAQREKFWISELETLHPNGLNTLKGGQIGGAHGKKTIYEGRTFPSLERAAKTLAEERNVPLHIARTRIVACEPIPEKPRTVERHFDATGSSPFNDLWRIHKSLLRRIDKGLVGYAVADEWRDYDRFKADVLPSRVEGTELAQADVNAPLGPKNFRWMNRSEIVTRSHGRAIIAGGVEYATIDALAKACDIARSTLIFRLNKGMTPDEAVALGKNGKTSAKTVMFEGLEFRSMHAAAAYAAKKYGLSHGRARDFLRRNVPFTKARSPIMSS